MSGAIGGIASGIGSFLGGEAQAQGAKESGRMQAESADRATQMEWDMYEQTRSDMAPWRNVGQEALYSLSDLMGVPVLSGASMLPEDRNRLKALQTNVTNAEHDAWKANLRYETQGLNRGKTLEWQTKARDVLGGLPLLGGDKFGEYDKVLKFEEDYPDPKAMQAAVGSAQSELETFKKQMASKYEVQYQPESARFGELSRQYAGGDFQVDPGYQFRLSEGTKAQERAGAARGRFFSGRQGKELSRYGQEFASNEFSNAYNRWNQERTNLYNRLAGLSGTGQMTAQQIGSFGAGAAGAAGQYQMAGAKGQGEAFTAAAQARGTSYQNIGNALGNAWDQYQYGKGRQAGGQNA